MISAMTILDDAWLEILLVLGCLYLLLQLLSHRTRQLELTTLVDIRLAWPHRMMMYLYSSLITWSRFKASYLLLLLR